MRIYQGIHVVLHLKLLVPPNHMSSQYLAESSQYVLSSRHMSLKILSRTVHVIFLVIHVGLHLKLLVPTNHMSSQDLGASSQHVLSSRHMSLKILSRMVHVHLSSYSCGLHLKLLQPTNHISLSRSWCIVSICRILKTRHRFCPSRPHCSVRRWLHLLPCSAQPFWLLNCRERMTTQYIRTIDNLFPPELSVATAHPNRVNILNTTIAVFTFLSGCTTP